MTTDLPEINPAGRFSPSVAAALLRIDRATLWRNTKRGNIRCSFRSDNGRRFYRGSDIIAFFNSER